MNRKYIYLLILLFVISDSNLIAQSSVFDDTQSGDTLPTALKFFIGFIALVIIGFWLWKSVSNEKK